MHLTLVHRGPESPDCPRQRVDVALSVDRQAPLRPADQEVGAIVCSLQEQRVALTGSQRRVIGAGWRASYRVARLDSVICAPGGGVPRTTRSTSTEYVVIGKLMPPPPDWGCPERVGPIAGPMGVIIG